MRVLLIISFLLIPLPVANGADSGGGGATTGGTVQVPTQSQTPTPTQSQTPTPTVTKSSPTASAKTVATELVTIRSLLSAKNYNAAPTALLVADKEFPNNADINNLLGYTSRNLKQYAQASTYYTKSLKIDPKHLGALEYQGELFMKIKKTAEAKKNLAKLKGLCGVNCEEYLDLKKVIGSK